MTQGKHCVGKNFFFKKVKKACYGTAANVNRLKGKKTFFTFSHETVTEQSRMSAERFFYVLMCLKLSSVILLHP